LRHRLAALVTAVSVAGLVAGVMPPGSARAADNAEFTIERLAGVDRAATAAEISSRLYEPGVPVAVVVTGDDFPDALAAGPAAHRLGGPVLFVTRNRVPTATIQELERLRPERIVVIGGSGVVSEGVRAELATLAPGGADRVSGEDRYATAAAVARAFFGSVPVVYVATGVLFPDGLAGGVAAAVQDGLLLLSRPDALPTVTRDELARLNPARIVVLGGTGAISAAVEAALGSYSSSIVRLGGADRYGTAVAISQHAFPGGASAAFLATGLNFPDALAGVPAAAGRNAPLLLAAGGLPTGVIAELDRLDPDTAFLLGGSAVVPVRVAKETQRTLGLCWSAFKPSPGSAQVYTRLATLNHIALTFDMGGRLDPAVQIMQFLVDQQVCATIFPTAASAQTAVGRQVMAIIAAHPELFEVGNHTIHHCNLRDGGVGASCPSSPPNTSFIQAELTGANTVIHGLTGQTTAPYWRPPYGAHSATVRSAAAAAGFTKTVMWDVDTIDWDPATTKDQILSRVLSGATPGSIVLLHLGGYRTLDALPPLVAELRARGYTLSTLSDMLD